MTNGAVRTVALVVCAIGVMFLSAALLQPRGAPEASPLTVIPDRFEISVDLADGKKHQADVVCEGAIKGTGYLASAQSSFEACTFDKKVNIHRYLRSSEDCEGLIADAVALPAREPLGVATITGIYFDKPIERRIDAVNGSECDRAAWKVLAPLLP